MSTTKTTRSTANTTASATTGGQDKLTALHEQISDGVAALVDTEGWRAMLDTAANFHSYSLGNLLLIGVQAPQATRVSGFRTWQSLGRQVRKGERGIAILAPCTYRPKTLTCTTDSTGEQPQDERGGPAAPAVSGKQMRGFRVVHVFDISQTDGDPLPEVAPVLLSGQAPAGLWEDLAGQVTGYGYALERGGCAGANGYTDPARQVVRVRGDVDEAQAVKVLAHELGHLECGHVKDLPTYLTCRGRCEVEAESVAYSLMWWRPRTAWTPAATPSPTSPAVPGATPRRFGRPPRPSPKQPAPSSAIAAPTPQPSPTTCPTPPEPGTRGPASSHARALRLNLRQSASWPLPSRVPLSSWSPPGRPRGLVGPRQPAAHQVPARRSTARRVRRRGPDRPAAPTRRRRRPGPARAGTIRAGVDPKAVRAWAETNGVKVNAPGRLVAAVQDQYRTAVGQPVCSAEPRMQ